MKGIEAALQSIHGMAAVLLKTPELMLTDQESAMVAKGVANVAQHYPDAVVDPKTLAWLNLAGVLSGVYLTRAVVISNNRKRVKAERAQERATAAAAAMPNVVDFQNLNNRG